MNTSHDITLCDDVTCEKRMHCRRFVLHLERVERNINTPAMYFSKVIDLGWGKTFTPDHSRGCCEFIPDKES